MPFTTATATVEVNSEIDLRTVPGTLTPDGPAVNPDVDHAVFMVFKRFATEQPTRDGAYPIVVNAWLLDGPRKYTFAEDLWVFPSGMRSKIDTSAVGARSVAKIEVYTDRRQQAQRLGFTTPTAEQVAAAEGLDAKLPAGALTLPGQQGASTGQAPPAQQQAPAPAQQQHAEQVAQSVLGTPAPAQQPVPAGASAGNGGYTDEPPW
jgi:hypothetical protein